jgi:ClpP class serine protease
LKERLCSLESCTGGDVLVLCAPIRFGLDAVIREAVDALPHKKRKLTVILETAGGYIEVTQRIAQTLRHHYRIIDFIIPDCAYSAGTVLAMCADEIYMDYFSVLGPIDPQVPKDDKMVPALGYLEKSQSGNLTTAELAFLINRFDPAALHVRAGQRTFHLAIEGMAGQIQV